MNPINETLMAALGGHGAGALKVRHGLPPATVAELALRAEIAAHNAAVDERRRARREAKFIRNQQRAWAGL